MVKAVGLFLLFMLLAIATAYCQAVGGNWYWASLGIILVSVPIGYLWLKQVVGLSMK